MNITDRDRLDKIEETLMKVYYAIVGNELDGGRGMSYRLQKAEEQIHSLNEQFNRVKWVTIGYAIGAGALGGGIINTLIQRII